jgi:L-ascorbate 6-phosphate lactonase
LKSEWFDWFLTTVESYRVRAGAITLWSIGGAGFIFKTSQATIYIDPYCGGSISSGGRILHRMVPIPFNPDEVKSIDATVITHEDLDHLSEDFVFPISDNTDSFFIGPESVTELLKSWKIPSSQIITLKEWHEKQINNIAIKVLPSKDPIPKTANTYLFECAKIGIFHSGDSLVDPIFKKIGKKYEIEIALISVGVNPPGERWYNTPEEAVEFAQYLGARILIPIHWDIWDIALCNPHLVEEIINRAKLEITCKILRIGERFDYSIE